MVTTSRCSVISLTVRVLGTATSIPDCSTGAVIMKMTSSTSTTSTSGVMLISASEVRVWPLLLVKATVHLPGGFLPVPRLQRWPRAQGARTGISSSEFSSSRQKSSMAAAKTLMRAVNWL